MRLTGAPKSSVRRRIQFVITIMIVGGCFIFAGRYLVVNETPVKSNVIIVLGGGTAKRAQRAVELYDAGYAPYILASGGSPSGPGDNEAEWIAFTAEDMGVSKDHIILEKRALSTYQNALYTRDVMKNHKFTSAIVVSSNYHMRRVKFLFDSVYNGTGIKLTYCSTNDSMFNPEHWWANPDSIRITLSEYVKLGVNIEQMFVGWVTGRSCLS